MIEVPKDHHDEYSSVYMCLLRMFFRMIIRFMACQGITLVKLQDIHLKKSTKIGKLETRRRLNQSEDER